MRMVIIGGIVLLLLAGGAGGYFYFFANTAEAAAGEEAHDKKDKRNKKKKGDDHSGGYEFIQMDALILPIVDNSGVTQTISVVVALEVEGKDNAGTVEKMTPRLKDAYIQDMYGVLNDTEALKGGVVQVTYLKNRLNKVTAKILGDDVVNDVLLQVVQQRPI